MISKVALCVIGLGTVASVADAQRSSFTPTLGVYIPTTELVKASQGQKFKQEVSLSIGAKLALWFSPRIGFEAVGDYAPSKLHFSAPGSSTTESANIISGSGRLTVYLIPATSMLSLRVSAGASGVRRSGDAYADGETDVGGVLGLVVGLRLGGFNLQMNVDDYVYQATFTGATQTSSQTQHDIHIGFGYGGGQ